MDAEVLIENGQVASLQGPAGARRDAGDVGLLPGHSIAIQDARIHWMGPADEWDGTAEKRIDATGRLVTPGYVDPHTHLVYAGDRAFELPMKLAGRSYLDILAAGGGIAHTTTKTRQASLEELADAGRRRLARMIVQGTTALEAKSGYALETDGELRMLAAHPLIEESTGAGIASTFCGAHAVPSEWKDDVDGFVDVVIDEMLPRVQEQGIARYCDVFVEEGVFTVEQGERILTAAKRHGLQGRLHADEIVCTGGASLAARVGCVTADHLLNADEAGIQAMGEAGTMAVMLPTVPLTLMDPRWPSVKAFQDAGVPIALATDHNPNNPVTDMGLVAQLACYALGMRPEEALTGVTWNAAVSLGWEGERGVLQEGARGDVLVHGVEDLAHWVHEPGRKTVEHVVLGGRMVR